MAFCLTVLQVLCSFERLIVLYVSGLDKSERDYKLLFALTVYLIYVHIKGKCVDMV